jgi:hypothetical protein
MQRASYFSIIKLGEATRYNSKIIEITFINIKMTINVTAARDFQY